ncbi:MAG: GTP-binding protein [Pseudomonadota bacterium]
MSVSLPEPLPVTLLTGFLGSGKTTLLNRLIRHLPRTAVVMNEFGEISLDHDLLEKMEGPMAVLSGGCVCCTVVGSLSPTLKNLYMARERGDVPHFERVVIETTGIADPAPILGTLLNDPWVRARYRMDGVVTTVDAVLGEAQLDSYFEAQRQVAVADRLILTKTDLATADLAALKQRLAELNPAAEQIVAVKGNMDFERILDLGLFNARDKVPNVQKWLNEQRYKPAKAGGLMRGKPATDSHDNRIRSFSVIIDEPIAPAGLQAALEMLVGFRSEYLLRFKAIVNLAGHDRPTILHGVQHVLYPETELENWPSDDRRSRFVFIVRDLEPEFVARVLEDFSQAAGMVAPASTPR